ncbi:hypothetical protein [Chitinophaga pinensis]|uniref:Uncharacterized protein n=1 Tax=Chitinophaga pinensis TaxID=79329 RepID=A0A5C6LZW6_9BACT|nr:hypothetical protein [Chitinophaga pinensis]TWW02208.1 hypothetical protein FEF09_03425 [Chitinophaga pinensis]
MQVRNLLRIVCGKIGFFSAMYDIYGTTKYRLFDIKEGEGAGIIGTDKVIRVIYLEIYFYEELPKINFWQLFVF